MNFLFVEGSTFRCACAVSNMLVVSTSSISCLPGMWLRYFRNDFYMVSVAAIITGTILGAFIKLRKATVSIIMPVSLSACQSVPPSARPPAWNNSASTGRIFMKFCIGIFFESLSRVQMSIKREKNNGYFT